MNTSQITQLFLLVTAALSITITALIIPSCEKDPIQLNQNLDTLTNLQKTSPQKESICGEIYQKPLYFEQNYAEVGHALLYNDNTHFYVEINAWDNYLISDAFLYIGTLRSELPLDKFGNPDLSLFQYSIEDKPWSNQRKFRIPLSEMTGHTVQSVAVILKKPKGNTTISSVNAWVDGHLFGSSERGRYYGYDKQICRQNQPVTTNE